MDKHFNLIDEPWILVADKGRVSLRQVFSEPDYRALGGNPVEKIAVMKLLLAIAQAAATPEDDDAWRAMGAEGMAHQCLAYLEKSHGRFDLYGPEPFLQMPAIACVIEARTKARLQHAKTKGGRIDAEASGKPKPIGPGFYPDLPSTNNTELSQALLSRAHSDAERAVFLITLMNFAFGGKRVESNLTSLAGNIMGPQYSAPAGPSLGGWDGQLHCFLIVDSIVETIWLNVLTHENVRVNTQWCGVGRPIWEGYPKSENDAVARAHKETYQASLVAMSRFVLFRGEGIYYLDGINYPKVKDGWMEPSLVVDRSRKEIAVRYVDPQKKPWRELEAILVGNMFSSTNGFECHALRIGLDRVVDARDSFTIWCSGLKVSSNSGDQSVKRDDDFVESIVRLKSSYVRGEFWFAQLQSEMKALELEVSHTWGCVAAYFSEQMVSKGDRKRLANQASHMFWQLCERDFQHLLDHCEQDDTHATARHQLRRRFAGYAQQAYDRHCPKDTARQLDAWARCRPNHSKYLQQEA